jgi:hypothetical protein
VSTIGEGQRTGRDEGLCLGSVRRMCLNLVHVCGALFTCANREVFGGAGLKTLLEFVWKTRDATAGSKNAARCNVKMRC